MATKLSDPIPTNGSLVLRWLVVCGTRAVYTNGQHTYATQEEAQKHATALVTDNSKDKLESVFGKDPKFTTRQAHCRVIASGGYATVMYEPVMFV